MNILLLSRYSRLGASSRVRFYQYLPYLRDHGFHVTIAPLLDDDYLNDVYASKRKRFGSILKGYLQRIRYLHTNRRYDLLWIEKELFPWLPAWAETLLSRIGVPYIVDYDDAIFHNYDLHHNKLVCVLLGNKIDTVMHQAALVIAGNDYLANRARQAGARQVEVLPSVIDLERYPSMCHSTNEIFTIGWIGTPVTARYLRLIRSALAEVCQGDRGRLVLVGSGQVELDAVPAEIRRWSEKTEVANIQGFDVGIMPLPDDPWERGKCGYKLIQYMACSKPVVASPVGVNKQIVEDGVNGFLASTIDDWVRALSVLRDNPDLRKSMGKAGRRKVEAAYSVQVTAPRLVNLLRSVRK